MKTQAQMNWSKYLRLFSDENRDRPTRIAVYDGEMRDYWLENGMPLAGVEVDLNGNRGLEVEIMLANCPGDTANMTHRVVGARSLKITLSASGEGDGLEIANDKSETTVLHFEDPELAPFR